MLAQQGGTAFGLAILDEIAHGDSFPARAWGRMSLDYMVTVHEGLLVQKDPRESLMRLLVVRGSFFDFDPVIMPALTDGHATIQVNYGMPVRADQAACYQTLGFFGRLVELSGGRSVITAFTQRSWEGDPVTAFTVDWEPPK